MDFLDIATEAAQRWNKRQRDRNAKREKIDAGKAVEAESLERIQLRLNHLPEALRNAERDRNMIASLEATPEGKARLLRHTIGLERVVGKRDFLDVNFMEIGLAVARFVGRVNIRSAQGRSIGYGTGFMVSPRLLMTNHHVLEGANVAQTSEVEFDYQSDRTGRLLNVAGFSLEPDVFFMTDKQLDFTLVAVKERSPRGHFLKHYGWSRLIGTQGKAILGDSLNIIQHPRGEPKQLVLRSNEVVDLFDQYVHYVTDTEPGSSGSGVYNDQWELVALHHAGIPKTDNNGNLIGKNDQVWTDGMDPDNLAWVANEGIRVSSLIEHIKAQPLAPAQDRLRHELLTLVPPSPIETALAEQYSANASNTAAPVNRASPVPLTGNSLTLPLTISVQFGPPASQSPYVLPDAMPAPASTDSGIGMSGTVTAPEEVKIREYNKETADVKQTEINYRALRSNGKVDPRSETNV